MINEFKKLDDYCKYYFESYKHRDVICAVRRKRYEQIRENNFYLNEDGNTFKDEALKFWEVGYNYNKVWIRDNWEEEIPFLDNDGNVSNADEIKIMEKLKRNELKLRGNYTLSRLHRGGDIIVDMNKLEVAMNHLLALDNDNIDDNEIIRRYNEVIKSDGDLHIRGMGHAKGTMFLHMRYPDKYGMWDQCTEKTFKLLSEVDSEFRITESDEAEKYIEINECLLKLKNKYPPKDDLFYFLNLSDVDMFVWYISLLAE